MVTPTKSSYRHPELARMDNQSRRLMFLSRTRVEGLLQSLLLHDLHIRQIKERRKDLTYLRQGQHRARARADHSQDFIIKTHQPKHPSQLQVLG